MSIALRLSFLLVGGILVLTCTKTLYAQSLVSDAPQTQNQETNVPDRFPVPNRNSQQSEMVQVSGLASRLLQYADAVDCRKRGCRILVTDFVSYGGNTSTYGTRLADELAAGIADQQKKIQVIDRSLLKGPLDKLKEDRVPGIVQHSVPVSRWVGQEVGATIVVIGEMERSHSSLYQVSARLQNVKDAKLASPSTEVAVQLPPWIEESDEAEPPKPLSQMAETANGDRLYNAGAKGLIPPRCSTTPSPPYTDEARKFQLSGMIIFESIVEIDGSVKPLRIIRGLPFGLNDTSFRTAQRWKCTPATMDGKPVRSLVPFEITFRLY